MNNGNDIQEAYREVWTEVKTRFPDAVLMRGSLEDAEEKTGSDLDILIDIESALLYGIKRTEINAA